MTARSEPRRGARGGAGLTRWRSVLERRDRRRQAVPGLRDAVIEVVVAATGLDPHDIGRRWTLADLGVTSFATMRLVMALEERFGVELSAGQVAQLVGLPVARFHEVVVQAHAPR